MAHALNKFLEDTSVVTLVTICWKT